jgi:hypothetical protein
VPVLLAGHVTELKDALHASAPFLLPAWALSLLLLALAALPSGHAALQALGRRTLAWVGGGLAVGAGTGVLMVYWFL